MTDHAAVVTNSSIIHSDKKTASTQYNKLSQQSTIVGSTNVNTKLDFDEKKMVNAKRNAATISVGGEGRQSLSRQLVRSKHTACLVGVGVSVLVDPTVIRSCYCNWVII
jgi:hypothetical protein